MPVNESTNVWNFPGLSDELLNCLALRWSAGKTALKLSGMAQEPISRCACIGKAKRMGKAFNSDGSGFHLHGKPTGGAGKRRVPKVHLPRRQFSTQINGSRPLSGPALPQPITAPPEYLGLTIIELGTNQCRYSHSEASPFLFCGAPTEDGSSWCEYHAGVCLYGFGSYRHGGSHVHGNSS